MHTFKRRLVTSAGLFLTLLAAAGGTAYAQSNPVPLINQPLVPDAVAPGGQSFTLTVNGTGFVSGSVVQWNGTALATTFVSGSQLTATVPASDIATARTASVTVVNPGTGTISNVSAFEVVTPAPGPSLDIFSNASTSYEPGCVSSADLTGNGIPDLVVCDFHDSQISVYLGKGGGTFEAPVAYDVGASPDYALVADVNGDAIPDIVVACGGGPMVLLGNGDGTFAPGISTGDNLYYFVAAGDFNGDGKLDLAIPVPTIGAPQIAVLLGNGDGTFQAPSYYAAGDTPLSIVVGDFNNDGKLDLAVSESDENAVGIFLGNGDGTFGPFSDYPTSVAPYQLVTADFNGDGNLDLAVAASGVSVLLGRGDGTFASYVNYATVGNSYYLAATDLNGDGKVDLAVTAALLSSPSSTLLGNGDGTFQRPGTFGLGPEAGAGPLSVSDFNDDGRPDLVLTNIEDSLPVLLQVTSVVSPTELNFGGTKVGSTSPAARVSLTNVGSTSFTVTAISVEGKDLADFTESNNCAGKQIAPGANCTLMVRFRPQQRGPLNADVTVRDSGNYSAQVVGLIGTGQ
jgi:hypothetical protein